MAVQTPSYWEEEKYQPMIEAMTYYGNKVMIPQVLQKRWEFWKQHKGIFPHDIERAEAEGFFKELMNHSGFRRVMNDTKRVYYERYQE